MNERILELLVQSGLLINVSEYRVNELDPNIKKFAELIVKECFNIVDNYAVGQASKPETYLGESLYVSLKITDAAWKIKEHFGVKE